MYKIIIHKRSHKYLKKLPTGLQKKIKRLISQLIENPLQHAEVKPMFGEWKGYYRAKSGKTRIIFWIDPVKEIVFVDYIGSRGDIYK